MSWFVNCCLFFQGNTQVIPQASSQPVSPIPNMPDDKIGNLATTTLQTGEQNAVEQQANLQSSYHSSVSDGSCLSSLKSSDSETESGIYDLKEIRKSLGLGSFSSASGGYDSCAIPQELASYSDLGGVPQLEDAPSFSGQGYTSGRGVMSKFPLE